MSHPDNTSETASEGPLRRPGRVRTAILALKGHPVVPEQIRAEWAAWQLELEAICDKISAAASRMATRDKRDLQKALARLEELEHECGCKENADQEQGYALAPFGSGYSVAKRALNRQVMAARGRIPSNGGAFDVDGDEAGTG